MTRAVFTSFLLLGLACSAAAQPAADAGWNECVKTPTRACVLRRAVEVARTIDAPRVAAADLSRIAEAQSKAGLSAEAAGTIAQCLQVAASFADVRDRDVVMETIAKLQAEAGKFADALDSVGSMRNPYLQALALGAIAVVEGKAGRLDEALRRVQAIEDLRYRALIMRRVAWDLRASAVERREDDKLVTFLAAVQAIEQLHPPPTFKTGIIHPSDSVSISALGIIAQAQGRAGQITDAIRVARSVTNSAERARVFATIAVELARGGRVASALNVAPAVDDGGERGFVLERILESLVVPDLITDEATTSGPSVKPEAPDAARDVVAVFTDRMERATALGIAAVALASAGRLAEAIELAEPIDQGKPRALAWHAIAAAQAKAGQATQSIASFDRAVQAALSFRPHDRLLSKIAISQAEAGQITEALRVTRLIGGTMETAGGLAQVGVGGKFVNADFDRRWALYAVAKAQAKAGSTAEALQTARTVVLTSARIGSELGVVAEALAEAGRITEAIELAAIADNIYDRSRLLASIATARAAAGRIDEAQQVTQHVAEGDDRVDALVSIAAARVKAGLMADALQSFAEAMRVTQSLSKNKTTQALMAIAAQLPD